MPFLSREENAPDQQFSVAATFNHSPILKGVVGLEIEVEGNKFPKPDGNEMASKPVPMDNIPQWSYVHDGSLRGRDNAEYVLTTPLGFDAIDPALDVLYRALTSHGSVLDNSHRTSTHVHLNVQEFYVNRLTSLMALYITFEEILTQWCGEHRVGNLFCLRAKDAPAVVSGLRKFIRDDMGSPMKDYHKYAGMNASCIPRLGSLEFRALRGVSEPEAISEWVGILRRLYELSAEYPDPRELCYAFSGYGPLPFFEHVLGDQCAVVMKGVDMGHQEITDSLLEGIRMAQDLCFARSWENFKELRVEPDVFGRDIRTVMRRLKDAQSPQIGQTGAAIPEPDYYDPEDSDEFYDPEPEYDDTAVVAATADLEAFAQLAQAAHQNDINAFWAGTQWATPLSTNNAVDPLTLH